eukprot:8565629-Alexandrium_andersonii.AAC.1
MVRWIAPYRTPLSWRYSNPGASRTTEGCPCAGMGSSCFSARSRTAPTCGKRPSRNALARCFHRRYPWGWASKSSLWYESDHIL